ncbi:MAG: LacI family transcriptional regulator [Butyrivibrio sp.]|jgi:LacI family transcriptional regulator/LacI family repressor for deo operon, udp, cdd, tsx, nupC, and nupG|nr:LacI family transcriptional regulator [Butyrivibrio sp.]
MEENKKVTIYNIAKEAGVSPATVSRVLTNSANVKSEKKERILELIKKYNFTPSAVARGLSDTRSRIIGIIVADVRNTFYADMYVACERAADKEAYTVMMLNSFGDIEMEKKQLSKLIEWRADAIIQLGGAVDDMESNSDYVKQVNSIAGTIPFVVNGKLDGTNCYKVQIDAAAAMDMLVEHLANNGNKKIALVGGRIDVESTNIKYFRFKELVDKYGLNDSTMYSDNWGGYTVEEGIESMDALFTKLKLAAEPLPDAVICINDNTAVGVIKSIRKHGYRIPEDISVVSYDNIDIAEIIEPGITSVAYDYDIFGSALIQTALDAIDKKDTPRMTYIKPKGLVVRGSSDYKRNHSL